MSKAPVLISLDYPPERGGVARYLGEFVRASGPMIDVVVESDHDLGGPGRSVIPRRMFRMQYPKWWPTVQICREFRDRPYLIVSHVLPMGTAAMIAEWMGGAPYVVICHGLDVKMATRNSWKTRLFSLVCRRARLVIANSEATKALIQGSVSGLNPLVLTPGVRLAHAFKKADARRSLGIDENEKIVLAVARLIIRKGLDTLIRAMKSLNHAHARVVIVGYGPEEPVLKSLATELGINATFVGEPTDEDVCRWYAASDVFAVPVREGVEDIEGYGIVFLEAALSGLPVIAGKTGGAQEAVIDGYTGFLVLPDNPEELGRKIQILLEDADLRLRFGEAGRMRAERDFRWEDRWHTFQEVMKTV